MRLEVDKKKKEGNKENSEKGEAKSAFEGWPEKKRGNDKREKQEKETRTNSEYEERE